MNSISKPPLPTGIDLIGKRPELFCFDSATQRACDEYNQASTLHNKQIWDKFKQDLERWKIANSSN